MTPDQEISQLVRLAFPVEPLPRKLFWPYEVDQVGDFTKDFLEIIAGRPWTAVSVDDWRISFLAGGSFRNYIEPSTFLYYIPSLLIGAMGGDLGDIQVALEEILPFNKDHTPRGKWWTEYSQAVSAEQRSVFSSFLTYLRNERWDQLNLEIQLLVSSAEAIWSSR